MLSMPVPRATYCAGKLAGFAGISVLLATACGLALAGFAPPAQVALWTASLGLELLIVIAMSLLCVLTFSQITWALSTVIGFYVLSRAMAALHLMAHEPPAGSPVRCRPAHPCVRRCARVRAARSRPVHGVGLADPRRRHDRRSRLRGDTGGHLRGASRRGDGVRPLPQGAVSMAGTGERRPPAEPGWRDGAAARRSSTASRPRRPEWRRRSCTRPLSCRGVVRPSPHGAAGAPAAVRE